MRITQHKSTFAIVQLLLLVILIFTNAATAADKVITYQYGNSTLLVSSQQIRIQTPKKNYDVKKILMGILKTESKVYEPADHQYGIQLISAVGPIVSFKYWYATYFPNSAAAGVSGGAYIRSFDMRNPNAKVSLFNFINGASLSKYFLLSQDYDLIDLAKNNEVYEGYDEAWLMPTGGTPCCGSHCKDLPNSPDGFAFAIDKNGNFVILFQVNSMERGDGIDREVFHVAPIETSGRLGNWLNEAKSKGSIYTLGSIPPAFEFK